MYSAVFGQGQAELVSEFQASAYTYFEEFDQELREVPSEKPYEFCNFIKHSGGEERKIMDFKTGKYFTIQVPPRLPSSSRRESSWLSTHARPWETSSLPKPCVK